MINTDKIGLILYVKEYKECIEFYEEVLELKILFKNTDLTCFNFYGTYLMVEKEDRNEYLELELKHKRNFTCLRMNVDNVKNIATILKTKNVAINYQEFDWGKVAKFKDPAGNLIALKDSGGFNKQVQDYKISR